MNTREERNKNQIPFQDKSERYSLANILLSDGAQGGAEEPLLNNIQSSTAEAKKEAPPPPYQP